MLLLHLLHQHISSKRQRKFPCNLFGFFVVSCNIQVARNRFILMSARNIKCDSESGIYNDCNSNGASGYSRLDTPTLSFSQFSCDFLTISHQRQPACVYN